MLAAEFGQASGNHAVSQSPLARRCVRGARRFARGGERAELRAAIVRANGAIGEAARGRADVSCAQALPKDLGEWRPSIEFFLGPFGCGKNLEEMSAFDFAKSAERDVDAFCR